MIIGIGQENSYLGSGLHAICKYYIYHNLYHTLEDSADSKFMIFFMFSTGDNLHEMSNPVFWN